MRIMDKVAVAFRAALVRRLGLDPERFEQARTQLIMSRPSAGRLDSGGPDQLQADAMKLVRVSSPLSDEDLRREFHRLDAKARARRTR